MCAGCPWNWSSTGVARFTAAGRLDHPCLLAEIIRLEGPGKLGHIIVAPRPFPSCRLPRQAPWGLAAGSFCGGPERELVLLKNVCPGSGQRSDGPWTQCARRSPAGRDLDAIGRTPAGSRRRGAPAWHRRARAHGGCERQDTRRPAVTQLRGRSNSPGTRVAAILQTWFASVFA